MSKGGCEVTLIRFYKGYFLFITQQNIIHKSSLIKNFYVHLGVQIYRKVMDNFGEVIYIIILIAFIAKGLLSAVKKALTQSPEEHLPPFNPQQKPQTISPADRQPKSMQENQPAEKSLLETIFGPEIQETTPQKPTKKKKNKQKTKNIQPTYSKQKEDNQLADTTEIGNEDSLPNMAPFQNVDDLKRAVIYSEILNRKYS